MMIRTNVLERFTGILRNVLHCFCDKIISPSDSWFQCSVR